MGYTSSELWYVVSDRTRFAGEGFADCLQFIAEKYSATLNERDLANCDSVGFLEKDGWRLVCSEIDLTPIKEPWREDWVLAAQDKVWVGRLGSCLDGFAENCCHLESGQAEAELLKNLYYSCLTFGRTEVEVGEGSMLDKVRIYQDSEKVKEIFKALGQDVPPYFHVRTIFLSSLPSDVRDTI